MDKQIEEMASIINGSLHNEYYSEPIYMPSAEELYNAGYRKASDVAREIINEIADLMWQGESEKLNYIIGGRYYSKQEFIAEIKKKYESEGGDER